MKRVFWSGHFATSGLPVAKLSALFLGAFPVALTGPVSVTINAYYHRPSRATVGGIFSAVCSALVGAVLEKRSQVVSAHVSKRYINAAEDSTPEGVNVQVDALSLEDSGK